MPRKRAPRLANPISPSIAAACAAADLRGRSSGETPLFPGIRNNVQAGLADALRVSAAGTGDAGRLRDHR
jgi:hypothetical protein